MPKSKKKQSFISKHEGAQTFVLKPRSQKDPLQADFDALKLVLAKYGMEYEDALKLALAKCGMEYDDDDDYDYLQHLKDRSELCESEVAEVFVVESKKKSAAPKPAVQFNLPSGVFPSKELHEEDMFDDDFMAQLNSEMSIHEEDEAGVGELDEEEAEENWGQVCEWMETTSSRVSESTIKEEEENECPKANTVRTNRETAKERKARKQKVREQRKYRHEQKKERSMPFSANLHHWWMQS